MRRDGNCAEVIDALLWSAGLDSAHTPDREYDADVLCRHATRHRVVGRLLRRIAADTPAWATDDLVDRLRTVHDGHVANYREQLRQLQDIEAVTAGHRPMILLKGPHLYALTGDEHLLRDSGDLDVLPADPARLTEDAQAAGYAIGRLPAWHEYSNLLKDGRILEVHRLVACQHPRYDVSPGQYDPQRNPGIWPQRTSGQTGTLMYDDCVAHCVPGDHLPLRNTVVPGPALGALVFMAHAFHDYQEFYRYGGRGRPLARIGELMEVADLLHRPEFDEDAFARLASLGGSERAVAWYAWAGGDLLGIPLPPVVRDIAGRHAFPSASVPTKIAADVHCDLGLGFDDVFVRRMPIAGIVERLGASRCALGDGDVVKLYVCGDPARATASRLIVADVPGSYTQVAVINLRRDGDLLFVKLTVPASPTRFKRARMGIDLGVLYTESVVFPPPDAGSDGGPGSDEITSTLCVPLGVPLDGDRPDRSDPPARRLFLLINGEQRSTGEASFAFLAPLVVELR